MRPHCSPWFPYKCFWAWRTVFLEMSDRACGRAMLSLLAAYGSSQKVRMIALKKFVWLLSKTSFVLN